MTRVLRNNLSGSSARSDCLDDDQSADYSFAMEYSGPPLIRDIPQVVPIDVRRIPIASMAARAVILSNSSLPVIHPILKRKFENDSQEQGALIAKDTFVSKPNELNISHISSTISDTSRYSDVRDDSNVEESHKRSTPLSSQELSSDSIVEAPNRGNRISTVTFREMPSSDAVSEKSDHDDEADIYPGRPVVSNHGKKGLCHRCNKRTRFVEKVVCIVCGAKYCKNCVLRAMGCMPEGRKCITCIGYRIDESKRGSLGKCSKMLRRMLTDDGVKKIMSSEISCEVNQLPPHLICVNDKPLSIEELVLLQSCPNPPKKLKPGKYWYDKVSGYWGKDGEKPCQIISAQLAIGYQVKQDASNGDTNVVINNRVITKTEQWMLQAAGIHCEGNLHFWLTADGSYQHEGMKNVMGKLWEKKRVKIVCAALSLPLPGNNFNCGGEKDTDRVVVKNVEQRTTNKLLLVGYDQSGTSTIFKQAKIVYNIPFSEDEKQSIKFMIQRNVYSYICILLDAHERFEDDYLIEIESRLADEPGTSEISIQVDEENIYSFSPRLKSFSDWLLQISESGNLEGVFPAATRVYSPLVEELWKDKAFQATYKRRNELSALSRAANYYLDRAVEITRVDYEPSQMDILYAEGITSSNGIACAEFSFPITSHDRFMETTDQNEPSISYQLIKVHLRTLGENCKWLEMFEDTNLVIYCVSLTDYAEYYEDINGVSTNKMLITKKLFETIVTHPTLTDKEFLLVLNKFDLLEETIERAPLAECDWFRDFNPAINPPPHRSPMAQRAFHYVAVKFKRLFASLTGRKLFVSRATGLEGDSIDRVLRYGREILKWNDEMRSVSVNGWSSGSMDPSTSV